MSITDHLVLLCSERKMEWCIPKGGEESDPVLKVPFPHSPDVFIEVFDDEQEATVSLGTYTHSHFSSYTNGLSTDERHREIAESVMDFLDHLFGDRVLIWKSHNGQSGGWMREFDISDLPGDRDYMVWSKVIQPVASKTKRWSFPWS